MANTREQWIQQAIDLAAGNVQSGRGGPFGALIVKDGRLIATGANCVTSGNDPTAHAEVMAIRNACRELNTFELRGCEMYTSCEPCPMCLGAIYWARLDRFYFACSQHDAAAYGFDDEFIYSQVDLAPEQRTIVGEHLSCDVCLLPFERWKRSQAKILY